MNKISYNHVKLATKKVFNLYVRGITIINSWLFKIKIKVPITFNMIVSKLFTLTLRIKAIRLNISKMSLLTNFPIIINLKMIALKIKMKTIEKWDVVINSSLSLNLKTKALQKIFSTIHIPAPIITFLPFLGQFAILGTYDPWTLLQMDGLTLLELDYQTTTSYVWILSFPYAAQPGVNGIWLDTGVWNSGDVWYD